MKLYTLSDLHTEFGEFTPPDTVADVVVFAGDIGVGTAGVEWAARRFPRTAVIYVPGNHEYYDHELHETSRDWLVSELASDFDGPTVVVTHHLPASLSISKRYANDPLNPARG